MIDLLARVLATNGLQPDSFTTSAAGEHIFRGEVQAGRVVETYLKLAKAFAEQSTGRLFAASRVIYTDNRNAIPHPFWRPPPQVAFARFWHRK